MLAFVSNKIWFPQNEDPVKGSVVVNDVTGKIVDAGANVKIPAGAIIKKLEDVYVTPGFIDCHTHMGLIGPGGDPITDFNEPFNPVSPQLRAIDATDYLCTDFEKAVEGGVTSVAVLPGCYCVVGGQACAMWTWGATYSDRIICENIGMKCAMGIRPRMAADAANSSPKTKMAIIALLRESLNRGCAYKKEPPSYRNLADEAWESILTKETPLRVHAYRATDIANAIRLADEYDIRLVLEHGSEALKLKNEIIERNIPIVITNTYFRVPQTREETQITSLLPSKMIKAGLTVAISTNYPEITILSLSQLAGLCLKHGTSYKQAMDSITINPARIMGIQTITGSLEAGKFADIVFWNKDPLVWDAKAIGVMIRGKFVPGKEL